MSQSPIISGTLQDLDLSMVMDVTCLGRQTLRLEVTSASGAMIGFVVLKAGRIISAEAGTHRGTAALAVILNAEAHARFRVVRDATDAKAAAAFAVVGEPVDFSRSASGLFAEGTKPKIPVMEGSLGDFDVPTLLQTIGMGRTYVEVDVLSESGQTIGSVILKSGKIMSARAGSFEGLQAVRELIDSPKHFQFAVFRVDDQVSKALQHVDPIGGLGQVLMQAQPPLHRPTGPLVGADAANRAQVMAGSLSEFDVPTLLQTLGAGRQYVGLEVHNHDSVVGTIMVKAGMVMSASAGELMGRAAFRKLAHSPANFGFNVFRSTTTVALGEPLGPLHKLLVEAMESPNSDRVAVMAGRLSDFSVSTLLTTLAENRQHTLVEIIRGNTVLGSIHVKSGMVCQANAGEQTGIAAFQSVLAAPSDCEFCVFRTAALEVSMPLGPLHDLLRGETWAVSTTVSAAPDESEPLVAPVAAPAKRRGVWIGIGIGMIAVAAAALFVLRPVNPAEAPVEPPVVSMALETSQPTTVPSDPAKEITPAEPAPPVQEAKPAEPAPPVQEPKPMPPVQEPKPMPPVQEPKPMPPVQEAKPMPPVQEAKPVPPVQEAKPVTKPRPPASARRMATHTAQSILARLGYPVGPVDNVFGPKTKAALSAFQNAEGLEATGVLNAATIQALASK